MGVAGGEDETVNRRNFIKRAIGGAALAIASLYVPGRPWGAVVPKPPSPQGGCYIPERFAEAIARLQNDGFIRGPRVSWAGITAHWKPEPPSRQPASAS